MLKKVLTILSALVLIICLFFLNNSPLFTGDTSSYEIYLDDCSNSNAIVSIKQGDYPFIFNKKGESVCIEKQTFELHSFLLEMKARLIFSEQIDGKICYYAYSPKIKYIESVKNQNINLQIVVSDVVVKVGSPIIYGSF